MWMGRGKQPGRGGAEDLAWVAVDGRGLIPGRFRACGGITKTAQPFVAQSIGTLPQPPLPTLHRPYIYCFYSRYPISLRASELRGKPTPYRVLSLLSQRDEKPIISRKERATPTRPQPPKSKGT